MGAKTRPASREPCTRCGEPSPPGTYSRKGVCKPCRDELGLSAKTHPPEREPCSRCHRPSPDGTRLHRGLCALCREADKPKAPKPKAPAAAAPRREQATFPVVVEQENAELRRELERQRGAAREVEKKMEGLRWAVRGFLDGHCSREDVERFLGF